MTPFSGADSALTFWAPEAERPGNSFRDFFRTLGCKAQMTRVNGQRYRNSFNPSAYILENVKF